MEYELTMKDVNCLQHLNHDILDIIPTHWNLSLCQFLEQGPFTILEHTMNPVVVLTELLKYIK